MFPLTERRTVAVLLMWVLLAMSAMLYPAAVPHAAHHAQHHATTHSSVLCSWLCSAGQSAELPIAPVASVFVMVAQTDPPAVVSSERAFPLLVSSRAPPALVV